MTHKLKFPFRHKFSKPQYRPESWSDYDYASSQTQVHLNRLYDHVNNSDQILEEMKAFTHISINTAYSGTHNYEEQFEKQLDSIPEDTATFDDILYEFQARNEPRALRTIITELEMNPEKISTKKWKELKSQIDLLEDKEIKKGVVEYIHTTSPIGPALDGHITGNRKKEWKEIKESAGIMPGPQLVHNKEQEKSTQPSEKNPQGKIIEDIPNKPEQLKDVPIKTLRRISKIVSQTLKELNSRYEEFRRDEGKEITPDKEVLNQVEDKVDRKVEKKSAKIRTEIEKVRKKIDQINLDPKELNDLKTSENIKEMQELVSSLNVLVGELTRMQPDKRIAEYTTHHAYLSNTHSKIANVYNAEASEFRKNLEPMIFEAEANKQDEPFALSYAAQVSNEQELISIINLVKHHSKNPHGDNLFKLTDSQQDKFLAVVEMRMDKAGFTKEQKNKVNNEMAGMTKKVEILYSDKELGLLASKIMRLEESGYAKANDLVINKTKSMTPQQKLHASQSEKTFHEKTEDKPRIEIDKSKSSRTNRPK